MLINFSLLFAVFYISHSYSKDTCADPSITPKKIVTGVAVMIETRKIDHLLVVVQQMKLTIDSSQLDWKIVIVPGPSNRQWIIETLKGMEVEVRQSVFCETSAHYNLLLMSREFWKSFDTDLVLIFHSDSLTNPNSKHKLSDFLQYDYIGAPWSVELRKQYTFLPTYGGNGGFVLSSVKTRLDMIETCTISRGSDGNRNEDIWFSHCLLESTRERRANAEDPLYLVANTTVAKTFSVESVYYEDPLGVHKPWASVTSKQFQMLKKNFVGLEEIASNWMKNNWTVTGM